MELRGNPMEPDAESFWRSSFTALVTGFALPTGAHPDSSFPARPVAKA